VAPYIISKEKYLKSIKEVTLPLPLLPTEGKD
jgi:hypothetical protein